MTDRPVHDAGPIACPFVAFEDDRDERADEPDHRHRCYAEVRPAPRAIAHQEAYCLSSNFAACPTFQDWARREAAKARSMRAGPGASPPPAPASTAPASTAPASKASASTANAPQAAASPASAPSAAGGTAAPEPAPDSNFDENRPPSPGSADELAGLALGSAARQTSVGTPSVAYPPEPPDQPVRNPRRGWAAPPPWMDDIDDEAGVDAEPPTFLAGRAERASSADDWPESEAESASGLAGSRWLRDTPAPRPPTYDDTDGGMAAGVAGAPGAAGAHGAAGAAAAASAAGAAAVGDDLTGLAGQATPSGSTGNAPRTSPASRGQSVSQARRAAVPDSETPSWERPARYEAYPTLKTRVGLPALPRVALAGLALLIAAAVLFSLPFALRLVGGAGGAAATPTPSASSSASVAPTPTPVPTAQLYVVNEGDTISKIAKKFGVSVTALLAANKQIKNPDKIKVGDELTIPVPPPSEIVSGGSPSPSP